MPRESRPRDSSPTPAGGFSRRRAGSGDAALLAQIFEAVPGGVVQVAPDGGILRANAQAQRFLGLGWDALSERFITDFAGETFHEDGSPCRPEEYPVTVCLRTGEPQSAVTVGVRGPDGSLRWAIFTALPFPVAEGSRMGAVVTFVDITERRRAEVRSRAHGRLLDTVRMVHREGDPTETPAMFAEALSSLLELSESRFGFIASFSGRPEERELVVHTSIDTHRGAAPWTAPGSTSLDALSRRALETGGACEDARPGALGGAFGDREPETAAVFPLRGGGTWVGVVGLTDAPGGYLEELRVELAPILDGCADLVTALRDRRARARLEAQLAQAERLASVGTLAAGMAHEVNNPLAYVLLNLEAFTRESERLRSSLVDVRQALAAHLGPGEIDALLAAVDDPSTGLLARLRERGRNASEGAERVRLIVRDLMTFSRVTEDHEGPVDINTAVQVALKMSHHEIKYRARLRCELGDVRPVMGHDGRLSQVILNLLLNAARAIPEGRPEDNEIRVATWSEDGEVFVEVADTGVGIDPAHRDRLFEPFFSTRAPGAGAGLGLSICHNVVAEHHGRIDVESELGVGTRFVVSLPAARGTTVSDRASAEPPEPARAPDERASTTRPRLLLIDDEPMVRKVLGQVLSRRYDVVLAEGLTSATEELRARDFDVVL